MLKAINGEIMVKNKEEASTFKLEESLKKLEQIISHLEKPEVGLEQSIKEFEEGVKLYQSCKDYLSAAQKKVNYLTEQLGKDE